MPITEEDPINLMNKWLDVFCSQNFTKRQTNIAAFLLRLTLGNKRHSCHIPRLKDFEMCGVHHTKVRKELDYLVEKKVINWDYDNMVFSLNQDTGQWLVPLFDRFNNQRYQQLVDLNTL